MKTVITWLLVFQMAVGNVLLAAEHQPTSRVSAESSSSDFRTKTVLYYESRDSRAGLATSMTVDAFNAIQKADPSSADQAMKFAERLAKADAFTYDQLAKSYPQESAALGKFVQAANFSDWASRQATQDPTTANKLSLSDAASAANIAGAAYTGFTWTTGPGAVLGAAGLTYKAADWLSNRQLKAENEVLAKQYFGKSSKEYLSEYSLKDHSPSRYDEVLKRTHGNKNFDRIVSGVLPKIDGKTSVNKASEKQFRTHAKGYEHKIAAEQAVEFQSKKNRQVEGQIRESAGRSVSKYRKNKESGSGEKIGAEQFVSEQLKGGRNILASGEAGFKEFVSEDEKKILSEEEKQKKLEKLKDLSQEFDKWAGHSRAVMQVARAIAGDGEFAKAMDVGMKIVDFGMAAKDLAVGIIGGAIAGGPIGVGVACLGVAFKALGLFGGGGGPTPEELILEQLKLIRKDLSALKEQIKETQGMIQNGTMRILESIERLQRTVDQKFEELNEKIDSNHRAQMEQHANTQKMVAKKGREVQDAIEDKSRAAAKSAYDNHVQQVRDTLGADYRRATSRGLGGDNGNRVVMPDSEVVHPDFRNRYAEAVDALRDIFLRRMADPSLTDKSPYTDEELLKLGIGQFGGLDGHSIMKGAIVKSLEGVGTYSKPADEVSAHMARTGVLLANPQFGIDLRVNLENLASDASDDDKYVSKFISPDLWDSAYRAAHNIYGHRENPEFPVCKAMRKNSQDYDAYKGLLLAIDSGYQLLQKQRSVAPSALNGKMSPYKVLRVAAAYERSLDEIEAASGKYLDAVNKHPKLKGLNPFTSPDDPSFTLPYISPTKTMEFADKIVPCNPSIGQGVRNPLPMKVPAAFLAEIPKPVLAYLALREEKLSICYQPELGPSESDWVPFKSRQMPGGVKQEYNGLAKFDRAKVRARLVFKVNTDSGVKTWERTLESSQRQDVHLNYYEPNFARNRTSSNDACAGGLEGNNPEAFNQATKENQERLGVVTQSGTDPHGKAYKVTDADRLGGFKCFSPVATPDEFYRERGKPLESSLVNTPENLQGRLEELWAKELESSPLSPVENGHGFEELKKIAVAGVKETFATVRREVGDEPLKQDSANGSGGMWDAVRNVDAHYRLLHDTLWHVIGSPSEMDSTWSRPLRAFQNVSSLILPSNELGTSISMDDFKDNRLNLERRSALTAPIRKTLLSMTELSNDGGDANEGYRHSDLEAKLRMLFDDLLRFLSEHAKCNANNKLGDVVGFDLLPKVIQNQVKERLGTQGEAPKFVDILLLESVLRDPIPEILDDGIDSYDLTALNITFKQLMRKYPNLSLSDVDAVMRQVHWGLSEDRGSYGNVDNRLKLYSDWIANADRMVSLIQKMKVQLKTRDDQPNSTILNLFAAPVFKMESAHAEAILKDAEALVQAEISRLKGLNQSFDESAVRAKVMEDSINKLVPLALARMQPRTKLSMK